MDKNINRYFDIVLNLGRSCLIWGLILVWRGLNSAPPKVNFQKLLVLFLSLLFALEFPISVFAQETIPPQNPPQDSNTSSVIQDLDLPSDPLIQDGAVNSLLDGGQNTSATLRAQKFVSKLLKNSYQAKEKIDVVVKNVDKEEADNLDIQIENTNGGEVKAVIEENFVNEQMVFSINPEVGLRPGKYTVKVIDTSSNQVLSEQDFTWGVLAINTNKSIYAPSDTANIAIAVLDEGGRMVCDAVVSLEITAPWGQKTTLSTVDGSITVNRECLLHQVTERPDYEATYLTSDVGRYNMTLTAATANGTYEVRDRFEVREYVPFDVERITATRIYPPEVYPVSIKIKANEDFKGKIVESVPQDFQISKADGGVISYQEESIIPESFDPKKEHNIPDLPLPFTGEYPQTLGFGGQIDGHDMEFVYKKSGIDGHDGIDFALPEGTPVLAVDGGKVILAKENWVYGHTVVIQHSWGRSYYGHLSEIKIKEGSFVGQGTELGLSGSTGLSTGPHLHFSLKPNSNDPANLYYGKIDPAPFFGLASVDEVLSVSDYPIKAKALVWNINIEKGAEFTIGYKYKAPNKSPYFYTLGPLQFISSETEETIDVARFDVDTSTASGEVQNPFVLGTADSARSVNSGQAGSLQADSASVRPTSQRGEQAQDEGSLQATNSAETTSQAPDETSQKPTVERVVFQEIRQWQIAVDVDSTVVLDANGDGTCGSGCWTVPSDWSDVNTIYAIGGGGAGDNLSTGGGGGGGGAFASITNLDLTANDNITFGVGAGGTDAVNGGTSWFNAASAADCTSSTTCVKGAGGTTATDATGGAGGSLTGTNTVGTTRFAGGAGGTGSGVGDDSTGGGGGAGSPNGTGGAGGVGDSNAGGDEASGAGGGSGCDSIGTSNDGGAGGPNGGTGGDSCFASGGTSQNGQPGNPGTNGSGGAGGDQFTAGGAGGDGVGASDPSLAGGGGGGGDDDLGGGGGNGGLYGGGGGGGFIIGTGAGGVIVIVYTQAVSGPTLDQLMRHGKWFNNGAEQPFTF